MIHRTRTKYGNTAVPSTKMLDRFTKGKSLRSKLEFNHALWLLSEWQAKRVKDWEYERWYELNVDGKLVCEIVPDFTVTLPDGRTEAHEIKSAVTMTAVWNLKMKIFQIQYPHIKYRVFEGGYEHKKFTIQLEDE